MLAFAPSRTLAITPYDVDLDFEELTLRTSDGVDLHAWWLPTPRRAGGNKARPMRGSILFAHGNGGNIGDRIPHAALLVDAGFDVLMFDYRGYGRSHGRPSEEGVYRDARAAREALLAAPGTDPDRIFYLGESLGGAVMVELALEHPPTGLILLSTFTTLRDMAKRLFPFLPRLLVPNAFPSLARIGRVTAPVLSIHGTRDELVPYEQGRRLYEAAPEPKHWHTMHDVGHSDLMLTHGPEWAETIAAWAR